MAESAPSPIKHKFLVFAPDYAGAVQQRLDVRSAHLEVLQKTIARGFIKVGGILLSPDSISTEGASKTMIGSTFICEAESIDEVRKVVEGDIYWKENVWDKERLVILPFLPAVGVP